MPQPPSKRRTLGGVSKTPRLVGLGVVGLIVLIVGLNVLTSFRAIDPGFVGVIQEGGPLDGRGVAKVKRPGTGVEPIGVFNHMREFPATTRNYIISADPTRGDQGGVDVFRTPTADSVIVGVEGQALFRLNLNADVLEDFYFRFGTRRFRGLHPYEGEEGWNNFLAQQFRPVLDNSLREEIGKYSCPEINAACALAKGTDRVDRNTGQNISKIQDAIATTLQNDLNSTLGGPYFVEVRFRLQQITLSDRLQDAVDQANAAKAEVSAEQQRVRGAREKAKAASELARAYRENPISGLIEFAKSLPPGSQPIINFGGGSLGLNVGRR